MPGQTYKSREVILRRALLRRGLRLERCPKRDPATIGYGLYRVLNDRGESLTGPGFRLSLDSAEAWAERARPKRQAWREGASVAEATVTLLTGDALAVLRTLPSNHFQCAVTSPPYWFQRDYGHDDQIGLEKTPEEWVARLVSVFGELGRTLRPDGVLWVVVGDAYNTRGKVRPTSHQPSLNGVGDERWADATARGRTRLPLRHDGLKEKDLIGLPWLLAFALRAHGWYLRSDVIWHKTATIPDPARDRPSSSHEHIFMFAKTERYYFDADAVAEPIAPRSAARYRHRFSDSRAQTRVAVVGERQTNGLRNARDVWSLSATSTTGDHPAMFPAEIARRCIMASSRPGDEVIDPFGGVGTTALAAAETGRAATLIELSPTYAEAARQRLGALIRV
jgi:DNA modification methylase